MTQVQFPTRIYISELPGYLLWGKKEQNALGKYVTWSLTIRRGLPTNTWTSWHSRGDTTSPNCPACFLQHSQSAQRESNLTRGKFTSTPPGCCYLQPCIEPEGTGARVFPVWPSTTSQNWSFLAEAPWCLNSGFLLPVATHPRTLLYLCTRRRVCWQGARYCLLFSLHYLGKLIRLLF